MGNHVLSLCTYTYNDFSEDQQKCATNITLEVEKIATQHNELHCATETEISSREVQNFRLELTFGWIRFTG